MSRGISRIVHHRKSKERPAMPFRKSPSMDRAGVERMAQRWGKVVARRVHEEVGPELDLDTDHIEWPAGRSRSSWGGRPRSWGPSSPARRAGGRAPCDG